MPIAIPSAGWLKLNTNGSLLINRGLAREGGIIRDEDDNWVMGFSRKIRNTTSFLVKMWNLVDELIICLNQNLSFVEVELGAKSIVDALANSSPSNNIVSPILDGCRYLVSLFSQVCIRHCFREANHCVDRLARIGTNQNSDFILYESLPADLVEIVEANLDGMY